VKDLQRYLQETFGSLTRPEVDKEKTRNLPLYLKGSFDLFASDLEGQKVFWAEVKESTEITPDQLKKQGQQLRNYLHAPVIFVIENLQTWQRKRLIEKKVGFAEPFRQLYVPELMLQLKDGPRAEKIFIKQSGYLKPPAQLLLLYHLQVQSLETRLFQEIAKLLNYSAMTVSRAVKELAGVGLVEIKGGKEKSLWFEIKGRQLWEKALPFLKSPVRDYKLAEFLAPNEYFRISGETALAAYTIISEPGLKCCAIGKEAFRLIKGKPAYSELNKNYGDYKLEIWHYDPVLLSPEKYTDKLSLYLSLKDEEDERVQGELEQLINDMEWLQD